MANDFFLKQGDTFPNLETILSDENGPVLLTGSVVTFRMGQKGVLFLEKLATIVTPQTGADIGKCYIEFETGETDIVGTYNVEWRVEFAGGKVATFPRSNSSSDFNKLVIKKDVG